MKKIAVLAAFVALFSVQNFAQNSGRDDDEEIGFRFGMQFSPTFSRLTTGDKLIEAAGTNWGAKLGVMAENWFTKNYAITTGLGFSFNQGGRLQNGYETGVFWAKSDLTSPKFDTLPKDTKLRYSSTFVEIPFGLKMRGGSTADSRIQFFAEAPVFTIGFLTKVKGDITGSNGRDTEDENIRESVNGLAISWGLGAGIEYELASRATAVLGIFYQKQMTDFTDNGGTVKTADGTWKKEGSKGTIGMITLRAGVFF